MTKTTTTAAALINLAAKTRPATKVTAKAALKAAGLPQTQADALLQAVADLAAARKAAPAARLARKLGYCPVSIQLIGRAYNPVTRGFDGKAIYTATQHRDATTRPTGRAPVTLPSGTPAQRLQARRERAISEAYARAHRTAAHGEIEVNLTTNPAAVGISQTETLDWNLYGGSHKGKPARVQDTTITAPTTWRTRVQRAGLAMLDGMMTLDAAPLEAHCCELFAAVWLVPGRGTTTTAARGYIARADGASYHAATIDQALTGLTKKRRALQFVARVADPAELIKLASQHAATIVTLGDARAVGACEYGIKSWCAAVGIDYEAGRTTLGEVLSGYQREPRPEARATIIRVLRRQRATA